MTAAFVAPAWGAAPVSAPEPFQIMVTAAAGDGLRFNNPYRLSTQLGSSAQSVSRTAIYADFGAAVTFGHPGSVEHGLALRMTLAREGVPQGVLAPSYLAWWRARPAWAAYARLAVPLVLTPRVTWGAEAATGVVWFVRAGLGVSAELVGDVFYGAATSEVRAVAYPVLSGQLGVVIAYEVLR